jgi:hypothetical protein
MHESIGPLDLRFSFSTRSMSLFTYFTGHGLILFTDPGRWIRAGLVTHTDPTPHFWHP